MDKETREHNRALGWKFPDEDDYPEDEDLVIGIITGTSPKGKVVYYEETPALLRFWGYGETNEWDLEDGKEIDPDCLTVHMWMPLPAWLDSSGEMNGGDGYGSL